MHFLTILSLYFAVRVPNALALLPQQPGQPSAANPLLSVDPIHHRHDDTTTSRRAWLHTTTLSLPLAAGLTTTIGIPSLSVNAAEDASMYAPKFVQSYKDFTETPAGWSYRDVKPGKAGDYQATLGDRVVFQFSGYCVGYFGRPFQAQGGPQGGAFDKDIDYLRTVLGSGKMVTGLEQAFVGMTAGGVRQVIVPYGDLSYPATDPEHDVVGPKPNTFSGMRALNFVLENPRVDRTLLFNIKVVRIDRPDGKGGFQRG